MSQTTVVLAVHPDPQREEPGLIGWLPVYESEQAACQRFRALKKIYLGIKEESAGE